MLKVVIRLVKPGLFLPMFVSEEISDDSILIRPTYLSICAADQRYFQGNRPFEILSKKLPLCLFHEALGQVVYDPTKSFNIGTNCILLPGGLDSMSKFSNYKSNSYFRSSTRDGFCQEVLHMKKEELLEIDNKNIVQYIFTELISVCCQAVSRLEDHSLFPCSKSPCFGIFGDGCMAYTMALTISKLYPNCDIVVFGKHDEKLLNFSFCTKQVNINDKSCNIKIDYAFECVGGGGAQDAIFHAINVIKPAGIIVLMGVSENPPIIPTRLILEKCITIIGASRSIKSDFERAKCLIDNNDVQ